MKEKKYKRIRCTECNSSFVYYKIRDDIWQCRSCGNKFKADKRKLGHSQSEEIKRKKDAI